MSRHLLDVNVLLALAWPRHESHAAARAWFAKSGQYAWATNALTQLGVLRLLTNPAVTHSVVSATSAFDALSRATNHAAHEFWSLDNSVLKALEKMARQVRGHQQWTDALLLCQAIEKDGVLVTFDSGVSDLAPGKLASHVLVLKRQ